MTTELPLRQYGRRLKLDTNRDLGYHWGECDGRPPDNGGAFVAPAWL